MALPFFRPQAKRLDQIVAVDLGGKQTKAVLVQNKNDRFALLGYTVQEAPDREKGWNSEALGAHFRSIFKALGDRTRHTVVALGVPDAFLRLAEMPPMPVGDMRQLLRLNSKAYLQQDLPDHVFDCWITIPRAPTVTQTSKPAAPAPLSSSGPPKQKVLVGGARRQVLDEVKAACRSAGGTVQHITPGMVGPANAFEVAEPEMFGKEVVALVDIGFKTTTITMLRQGELVMNRVVTLGGDRLTAGLAESLGISYAEAEGIKVGMPAEVQPNLEAALAPLGRELRASMDFFEHQEDVTVSQVLFSGGSARSEFIVRTLQNELMAPCKTWNPARTMHLALPETQRADFDAVAPQLAIALGAALAVL